MLDGGESSLFHHTITECVSLVLWKHTHLWTDWSPFFRLQAALLRDHDQSEGALPTPHS